MVNLYSKKLRSLDELKREKALKKAEASVIFNNPETGDSVYADFVPAVIDAIISKGIPDKLMAIAIPILQLAGNRVEKNILKKVAMEVLTGYAKWKGTELGVNALVRIVKRKFEKAAEERAD